jgi:hypothetical protein
MERAMGLVLDDLKKKRMRVILEKTT